jgi:hypothetical protein
MYKCPARYEKQVTSRKTYVLLAVLDSGVDQLGVFGLLGSREDQGRVGGGILRLVLADGCETSAIILIAFRQLFSIVKSAERKNILAKSPESHTTT